MPNKKLKIIFFGTPEFAVPFLDILIKSFDVLGVITQPDRPSGRKQTMTPPPVKILALKNNIKVFQPETIKNNSEITRGIEKLKPDLAVVVAYGEMIPNDILNIPKFKTINVHPSLLPKYRGASPVQSAILNGDKKTGVSIMLLDDKMDHGPILAQTEVLLKGDETNESLHNTLANTGKDFLLEVIEKYTKGELNPCDQKHERATYCKEIEKSNAKINWNETAEIIERKIRAFYPWPIAWTTFDGKRVKLFSPTEIKQASTGASKTITEKDSLLIGCKDKFLQINKLQLEGKNQVTAKEFISSYSNIDNIAID
jgi:methionyl-tRNA formyltransferase